MSKLEPNISPQTTDSSIDFSEQFTFGEYMRNVRKAQKISIRELAKLVGKTPTYISDIEKGNNKPPDKKLLDAILVALHIDRNPKVAEKLYDLAAIERGDIPADVKTFVLENPHLIAVLRALKYNPNEKNLIEMVSHD